LTKALRLRLTVALIRFSINRYIDGSFSEALSTECNEQKYCAEKFSFFTSRQSFAPAPEALTGSLAQETISF
jgi:hypothetical protein